ncbi:aspartate aminotransferase family protein [Gracilibacillus timonensis]|uniref:hypothetical protein n=1 Tax=Gracilibacillus timonensis TaxID=1816696 RepID=UPI000826F76D|nr:hypothetical protein [Gracilibacillus timonensis]
MLNEIGSHFEYDDTYIRDTNEKNNDWLPKMQDASFTFSGRSAIDLVLNDISETKRVKSVYIPAYCCSSMIEPFLKKNINVFFYNVRFVAGKGIIYDYNPKVECDIFFAMSYFGLEEFNCDNLIEEINNQSTIVIEDITHRLLCDISYSTKTDYTIASLRKWFGIPTGGYATKKNGTFKNKPFKCSEEFIHNKIKAMQEKYQYVKGQGIDKNEFMDKFNSYEQTLKDIDWSYEIDSTSFNCIQRVNIESIRKSRRSNAEILYAKINELEYIKPLIPKPDLGGKCPLFVPVMVSGNKRDGLRNFLIQNNVYCPVHWPAEGIIDSDIWKHELSLICDQRYSSTDMHRIINLMKQWESKIAINYRDNIKDHYNISKVSEEL